MEAKASKHASKRVHACARARARGQSIAGLCLAKGVGSKPLFCAAIVGASSPANLAITPRITTHVLPRCLPTPNDMEADGNGYAALL